MPVHHEADPLFGCVGEMPARCAAHDWAATPLGPVEGWPHGLRTAVAVLLRSRFPMILSWGEELVVVYNDPFIETLGAKHPDALGSLLPELFAEVWTEVGPLQRSVLAGGPSTYFEDLPLLIERGAGLEETFFTFSYSHVPDESGRGPGGVLAVLAVTTGKVVGARRLALLNDLAGRVSEVTDTDGAVPLALEALADAGSDLVGGACFLPAPCPDTDPAGAWAVAGTFGTWPPPDGDGGVPAEDLVAELVATAAAGGHRATTVTAGPEGSQQVVALPVRGRGGTAAVLVLAPHPHRPLDDEHLAFLDLVAEHVGQLLAAGRARGEEQARLAALAAVDAAKTALVSNVSHEFRTPLTLILGPLEDALATGGPVPAEDAATMHLSAHRLLRLVNGLLDVARLGSGADPVEREPTDLADLTRDLMRPFRSAAERAGLRLDCALEPAVGVVDADPHLWETVVTNLVANALKFTPSGWVSLTLELEDDEVVLRVADSGVGIPSDDLPRIFDRFHRTSGPTAHAVEGTGLGLALVAEAVAAEGGTVGVESTPGEGSTFEVRMPHRPIGTDRSGALGAGPAHDPVVRSAGSGIAAALAEELLPAERQARSSPQDATDGPARILVVDDNRALRERVGRIVSELGSVTTCADGLEALEHLRAGAFDLVVTDVMMPRLDGLGLLEEIRADKVLADLPVVVLSARAGAEAATGALESGADDYVVKPFTRSELLARCRTSLELSLLRRQSAAAQARATMLAGVSHDMQTPLSVVTTALELLADDGPDLDPAQRADLGRRARRRAGQLDRLVRQFLDWSRLSAGVPIDALLERVQLEPLVADVVASYPGARVGGVPAGTAVHCDPRRTEQVLHNLLGNASRVAREAVEVTVTVGDRPGDGSGGGSGVVEVRVRDDGPGVAAHVLPGLFAAFGPSEGGAGNGLGLHVSREAARAQGGDLRLEHTGPDGSTFVLTLVADD